MNPADQHEDVRAIKALIARQFACMNWAPGSTGNWAAFEADFVPDATVYPAARPLTPQSVDAFVARMKDLSETALRSFRQRMLGATVHVFGNVAIALGACENVENDGDVARGVESFLLVKDAGTWRIAAQAWDLETVANQIPAYLTSVDTPSA